MGSWIDWLIDSFINWLLFVMTLTDCKYWGNLNWPNDWPEDSGWMGSWIDWLIDWLTLSLIGCYLFIYILIQAVSFRHRGFCAELRRSPDSNPQACCQSIVRYCGDCRNARRDDLSLTSAFKWLWLDWRICSESVRLSFCCYDLANCGPVTRANLRPFSAGR